MARMGWPNRCDVRRDGMSREPVADRRPNNATQWHIEAACVRRWCLAGDQYDHAIARAPSCRDRLHSERVRSRQGAAVQINDAVRHDQSSAQLTVPPCIEHSADGWRPPKRWRWRWRGGTRRRMDVDRWRVREVGTRSAHVGGYAPPQRAFVSAELASHWWSDARWCRVATVSARCPDRTCRPRCAVPRRPRPKKCRSDWLP